MKSILVVGARGIPDVEGGIEKNAESLFPLIADQGWKVCVAGWKPYMQASHYRGVSLWTAPTPGFSKIDELVCAILTWFKALRMRPDLVHLAGTGTRHCHAVGLQALGLQDRRAPGGGLSPAPLEPGPESWVMRCARYQLRWADQHHRGDAGPGARICSASGLRHEYPCRRQRASIRPENAPSCRPEARRSAGTISCSSARYPSRKIFTV